MPTIRSLTLLTILFLTLPQSIYGQGERRAFTTSMPGTADFSSWGASGGLDGVDGADAICQTLAAEASLDNPQNFVAWISDTSDDAYCRLHGLSGKRSNNCGLGSLPVDAGPWLRTDDYPFADAAPWVFGSTGTVWGPLAVNEHGAALPVQPNGNFVFTASSSMGILQDNSARSTCEDWTTTSATPNQTMTGRAQSTTGLWSTTIQLEHQCQCDGSCHLYCLERLSGPAIVAGGPRIRLAFISSAFGPGDFTLWGAATPGITDPLLAADSICQNLALNESLENASTFKAYLATDTETAASRFLWDGPWWRVDGLQFTNSLADFADGTAISTLHQREDGIYGTYRIWTGKDGPTCNNWQDSSDSTKARIGYSAESGPLQTSGIDYDCDFSHRIYCLSDMPVPLVFGDGFESGDTSLWSAALP